MLQKELNHQQEQPRRRKNKSFQRKVSEQQSPQQSGPLGETAGWGGRGHLGSKSSPALSSAAVRVMISYTFGSSPGCGRIPETTWPSSPVPSRARDWLEADGHPTLLLRPWPHQGPAALGSAALEHPHFPQATAVSLLLRKPFPFFTGQTQLHS